MLNRDVKLFEERVRKNYEFFKNRIEWEIEDLHALKNNCQGGFTEHPSQDQHMSHWGCMEQISWSEQVVEYFDQACLGVFENERMMIANATVEKMGLQGLFIEYFENNIIPLPESP